MARWANPLVNYIFNSSSMNHPTLFALGLRRHFWRSAFCSLFVAMLAAHAFANSEIFPSEPAAEKMIAWKDGYFIINGKPTFISSGEMHYSRIPRELWRDRIWRAKQLGFNCVQMYVFWNATEGKEGQWDFTDNLDLDAWLTMIQDAGMYAIVRVGPYSCAEWDDGGLPAWLAIAVVSRDVMILVAVLVSLIITVSPSRMPALIMESPVTSSA